MNHRERLKAVLHYKDYDRLPIVHFGFWNETLEKWHKEGHLTETELNWSDGNPIDLQITQKLGFDFNYYSCFKPDTGLRPLFERHTVEQLSDGSRKVMNRNGVIELEKDDAGSIPAEIDYLLKDRLSWQEHYQHRLIYSEQRVLQSGFTIDGREYEFSEGLKQLNQDQHQYPLGLHCGSLMGQIRNWIGVEMLSYLYYDDPDLFKDIISTTADVCYQCVETALSTGAVFDFGHFWEDICFKNGPLVVPSVFNELIGPHYNRITTLLNRHNIDIISLDCDGLIDSLIPTWIHNGVNTMFPIEVGTWDATIAPWRQEYGQTLRGVGGMRKYVFALDKNAVDAEIERLKPLVDLGGYIPCPDHRIAPDAQWDNVRYYCDKMHQTFGG